MEFSDSQIEAIQCQFDWFCKRVMRNKAIDIKRKCQKEDQGKEMMVGFENMNVLIACYDEYFFEKIKYEACGYVVYVKEDRLVNILDMLPEKKRNILLLSHLVGLTDEEIAETLKISKKTLSEYRSRLLAKCKEMGTPNG